MQVEYLGRDFLEEEMATPSSRKIPWTEETGGLQSMGLQESWILARQDSCLENPTDREAW